MLGRDMKFSGCGVAISSVFLRLNRSDGSATNSGLSLISSMIARIFTEARSFGLRRGYQCKELSCFRL